MGKVCVYLEEKRMETAAALRTERLSIKSHSFLLITHSHIYRSYSIITSYLLNATLLHRINGIALPVYEILMLFLPILLVLFRIWFRRTSILNQFFSYIAKHRTRIVWMKCCSSITNEHEKWKHHRRNL